VICCFCWLVLKAEGSAGGKHRDKVIAFQLVNLKLFATIVPSQSQIEVHLQSTSSNVVLGALRLTLSCVFLRQGKATYVMCLSAIWRICNVIYLIDICY